MANNLNQCNFIGRLGNDPEIRFTQGGDPVANISLAVGETWKDKQGQKQESTEWVRGVAFGKLAEIIQQYTRKGSKLFISAKCKTRKWQDQSGQDRYTTEFVINNMEMLDSKPEGQQQAPQQGPVQSGGNYKPPQGVQHAPQQNSQQPRPQYAGNGQEAPKGAKDEGFSDFDVPF